MKLQNETGRCSRPSEGPGMVTVYIYIWTSPSIFDQSSRLLTPFRKVPKYLNTNTDSLRARSSVHHCVEQWGQSDSSVKLTAHLHPVSSLRMPGALLPLMAWCRLNGSTRLRNHFLSTASSIGPPKCNSFLREIAQHQKRLEIRKWTRLTRRNKIIIKKVDFYMSSKSKKMN
jgi:hypothetical protein